MIKSFLRLFIACLISLGSVLSTISWAEQKPVDVKPPVIALSSCLSTFTGTESVCLVPILEVSNPNKFLISVELDYVLEAQGEIIGASQIPTIYIPAQGTVTVKDAIVFPWMQKPIEKAAGGVSMEEAMTSALPLWKGLGGLIPAKVEKGTWDGVTKTKLLFRANGNFQMGSKAGGKAGSFSIQWQDQ